MSNLLLVAPMKGWVAPLDEVPDPVFAERILGEGLAIDPTDSAVRAPCDGEIVMAAKHAVTVRARNGAEILIHVGLETVALAGQGFVSHVHDGQSVHTGDLLLTFDLDFLASHAKSLISPVVLTNGDAFRIVRSNLDRETGSGEFLMEVLPLANSNGAGIAGEEASGDVTIALAHGIHARPAAILSNTAKRFEASISLAVHNRRVNAKSVAALMSLGVRRGERVTVIAEGPSAKDAVDAVIAVIESGLGEAKISQLRDSVAISQEVEPPVAAEEPDVLRGICASPGLAVGQVVHLRSGDIAVPEDGRGIDFEEARLRRALSKVRSRLQDAITGNGTSRDILEAHLAMLDDPEIGEVARDTIRRGKSAGFAWREAVRGFADVLRGATDPRLRERAHDLLDLERQVIAVVMGMPEVRSIDLPADAIVVAEELLPSEIVRLDPAKLAGLALAGGGPTSHVAILAAGMNIPALVGLGPAVLRIPEGAGIILDADAGLLRFTPDDAALSAARTAVTTRRRRNAAILAGAQEECRTADGIRIEVFANLGAGAREAEAAVSQGAEGCGLLRTEFLFLDRATPPGEEEQRAAYQAIADALNGRPLIVRTFDIGGDKPVAYLPFPAEDNPALGLRGVRTGLWQPELLRTQISAILKVKPGNRCRIMLPMISSLSEVHAVREMIDMLSREAGLSQRIAVGVMIETPSSAVLAAQIAREADFLSIGTNDLTQYTLAMDRSHPQLAKQIDAFHPAVLHMIAQAVNGARVYERPAGICGGLAADPLAAALLIGLGIEELSVPAPAIPALKDTIRGLDMERCRAMAREALLQETAAGVRTVARKAMRGAAP